MLAHLLKYDSVQGKYAGHTVTWSDEEILVDNQRIPIYAEADARKLPWRELKIDVVLECTGRYTSKTKAQAHIDAGAKNVTVELREGGIKYLRVSDNGQGIPAEQIRLAFERHATSKIATADDLGHIHTLGFRGEALASIASVAKVEVLTRTETDEYACCYRIEGGEPQGMEPGARPVGTTITVNDLFYNTPARMKFLKKDASEGTFVSETVLHAALSHPEISFRFLRDGKQQFLTPGDGDLRSTVYAVLGREFARDLLPVDGGSELYKVTGLVTPPRACRASRGAQHFFRAVLFRQRTLCQEPYDDGRAGKRLQRHDDAG